jgi:hypothetical protein
MNVIKISGVVGIVKKHVGFVNVVTWKRDVLILIGTILIMLIDYGEKRKENVMHIMNLRIFTNDNKFR